MHQRIRISYNTNVIFILTYFQIGIVNKPQSTGITRKNDDNHKKRRKRRIGICLIDLG